MSGGKWLLNYVCKFCGQDLGTYNVRSHVPHVLSVCDRRECREQASAAYKQGLSS